MNELIQETLRRIESTENVRILLAVEAGSRAWGFASADSDYDVRFVYVRSLEDYLRLDPVRDVIELPIDPVLDVNGWDLTKALRLLHNSNPTLFEWLRSPVVYRQTDFSREIQPLMEQCFSPQKGIHHYLNTALHTRKTHLSEDQVKAKKYFYVIRPLLACRWILERQSPPPVPFRTLVDELLEEEIRPEVERLLRIKQNVSEGQLVPRSPVLDEWIDTQIACVREQTALLPGEAHPGWEALNAFFREQISE